MDIIQKSFQGLFPSQQLKYRYLLKYNKKLGDFNANIKLQSRILQINLNYKWKEIDDEIKMGLIQILLLKMFAKKYRCEKNKTTFNIELYNNFIKKIPFLTPKTKADPQLTESFHRVNRQFFHELLDQPNLQWGTASKRKLACYNFHNDTVTVSTIFQNAPLEIIDYLIYHELLHKKQKFHSKNNRNYFHTKEFRRAEKLFPNQEQIEKQLGQIICMSKTMPKKKSLFSFFK